MKRSYNLKQRLIACILLLNLFLQSCNNFSNLPVLSSKEETNTITDTISSADQEALFNKLSVKELVAQGGHKVSFYQEVGVLQAIVEENLSPGLSRYHNLPVYLAAGMSLEKLANLDEKEQQRAIHVNLAKGQQPGYIYVGKSGLLVGENKNVKGKKSKIGAEEATERAPRKKVDSKVSGVETMDVGDFNVFPIEIIEMILSYVSFPFILECRRVNHFFYELITGYTEIGLRGVGNKPNPIFCSTNWLKEEVDFSRYKYQKLTVSEIPSFFFYRLIGKVKNLPQPFWSYILNTRVHTLILGNNAIGAKGVQDLAQALPGTRIHTLYLGNNQIDNSGTQKLAQALPSTQVHTLYLGGNQIGDSGVQELAKALPGTQIHTLNLNWNQIGDSGAQELAKALPGTQIHTLNLWHNQIGDSGAQELTKVLPSTQLHTLKLWGNRIGTEMQQLLKEQHSNITFYF